MNVETNTADSSFSDLSMDISTLEKNIEAFPYSSYARYLLLMQYKKKDSGSFEKAAKKTALYFNNPEWLHFQLAQLEKGADDFHKSSPGSRHFAVLTGDEIENVEKNESDVENATENILTTPGSVEAGTHDQGENFEESISQNSPEANVADPQINSFDEQHVEVHEAEDQTTNINSDENISYEENFSEEPRLAATNEETIYSEKEFLKRESAEENIEGNNSETSVTEFTGNEESLQLEADKPQKFTHDAEENITMPGVSITDNAGPNEEAIAFEPLHTVDYFASQGIKITDEVFTNDKLGTQMKSFTEWLKSMKKLHPGNLPQQNSLAEHIIQSAAETSNIDTEVLTEAMAEVLIKQDKREKAIEMYNKLSLINPAKSAYFAAKIENIKSA